MFVIMCDGKMELKYFTVVWTEREDGEKRERLPKGNTAELDGVR